MNIHMYYDEGSWERLRKLGGWFELQLSGGLTGGRVFELMLMIFHSRIFSHFEGLGSGFFRNRERNREGMSDVINKSALSAMQDFLRS